MNGVIDGGPIDTSIKVGDRVKSYDFPDTTPERLELCYKIGTVEAIEPVDSCDRYKIKVEKTIFRGEEDKEIYIDYVYPPVNGTVHGWSGKIYNGVIKI